MNIVKRINSKLLIKWKYTRNDLRGLSGLNEQLFGNARGSRIVIYHGICKSHHTRFNAIFLQLKTFELHLQFYKKYFHIVSLDDYYDKRFSKERFNICISFDDGFANNYKYVLPLLNKYKAPAAFFVTAIRDAGYDILWNDFLCLAQKYGPRSLHFNNSNFYKNRHGLYVSNQTGKLLKEILREEGFENKQEMIQLFEPLITAAIKRKEEDFWRQMTTEEIKSLSGSPLVTIGSHGYYHNDLSQIPVADARREMQRSKQWLENITGKQINAVAFPYGSYTRQLINEAKMAGFNQLLAADFLFPEDDLDNTMKERMTINPYISVNNQLTAIINGKYV